MPVLQELLAHPVMQSAVVPFVVSLVIVGLLGRVAPVWAGLCVAAAYAATVALTTGFALEPLTSTRKMVLLVLGAAVVGVVLDYLAPRRSAMNLGLGLIGVAAAVWMLWPGLTQKPVLDALLMGAGLAVFVAWMLVAASWWHADSVRAGSGALSSTLGMGVSAVLGASALYGQWGLALTAASGAYFLVRVVRDDPSEGSYSLVLPIGLAVGLLGAGGVVYAGLPWPALPIVACVPLVVMIPWGKRWSVWPKALWFTFLGMVPAGAAIYYTWRTVGGMVY